MPRSNEEHGSHAKAAVEDAKDAAAELGENVRNIGGQIGDIAREKYNDLRDQASDYYKQGREKASEWESGVEDYITEKPIHAILIAAGVGLLVGLMWRRR